MKQKLLVLAIFLLGYASAQAADNNGPGDPGTGKRDDLNGTVTHSDNKKPLEGVTVTAVFQTKKEKIVLTDDGGTYAFDELRAGTYKFIFEKAGYKKIVRDKIVIRTDEAFQMNIEMIENSNIELMPSTFSDF